MSKVNLHFINLKNDFNIWRPYKALFIDSLLKYKFWLKKMSWIYSAWCKQIAITTHNALNKSHIVLYFIVWIMLSSCKSVVISLRHLSNRMQEDCEMCDHTGKLGQLSDSLTRNWKIVNLYKEYFLWILKLNYMYRQQNLSWT